MKNIVEQEQVFKLIPKDIRYATKAVVAAKEDSSFVLKLLTQDEAGYSLNEPVEFFTTTIEGLLYFEGEIFKKSGNLLTVNFPDGYKYLQRREYTRVLLQEVVQFGDGTEVKIIDISAGGMQISSNTQLSLSESYSLAFGLDKKNMLKVDFQPIRIDSSGGGKYTISGRFKNLKNLDRISLVQFCFKKQIENQNK